jgi:KRAB domain-containing zinc finger protein
LIRKKAFSDNSNLAKHKRFYTGEKQYECDICKMAFALRNVLDKQIHTSEKPHECEMCKKAISSSSSLAKHKQIHTGEKP